MSNPTKVCFSEKDDCQRRKTSSHAHMCSVSQKIWWACQLVSMQFVILYWHFVVVICKQRLMADRRRTESTELDNEFLEKIRVQNSRQTSDNFRFWQHMGLKTS